MTDPMVAHHYDKASFEKGKKKNEKLISDLSSILDYFEDLIFGNKKKVTKERNPEEFQKLLWLKMYKRQILLA